MLRYHGQRNVQAAQEKEAEVSSEKGEKSKPKDRIIKGTKRLISAPVISAYYAKTKRSDDLDSSKKNEEKTVSWQSVPNKTKGHKCHEVSPQRKGSDSKPSSESSKGKIKKIQDIDDNESTSKGKTRKKETSDTFVSKKANQPNNSLRGVQDKSKLGKRDPTESNSKQTNKAVKQKITDTIPSFKSTKQRHFLQIPTYNAVVSKSRNQRNVKKREPRKNIPARNAKKITKPSRSALPANKVRKMGKVGVHDSDVKKHIISEVVRYNKKELKNAKPPIVTQTREASFTSMGSGKSMYQVTKGHIRRHIRRRVWQILKKAIKHNKHWTQVLAANAIDVERINIDKLNSSLVDIDALGIENKFLKRTVTWMLKEA